MYICFLVTLYHRILLPFLISTVLQLFVYFFPLDAFATHMHIAVYVVAWYPSVHYNPELCRKALMDHGNFLQLAYPTM